MNFDEFLERYMDLIEEFLGEAGSSGYNYNNSFNTDIFFAAIIGIALIVSTVLIVFYILRSVGLYRLAKAKGVESPVLAWIPVVFRYTWGEIAGDLKLGRNAKITSFKWWFLFTGIGMFFFSFIPFIGILFASVLLPVYMIFQYMAFFQIVDEYRKDSAAFWTILSVVLPFLMPIFIFAIGSVSKKEAMQKSIDIQVLETQETVLEMDDVIKEDINTQNNDDIIE